jgi:hypothetical protein
MLHRLSRVILSLAVLGSLSPGAMFAAPPDDLVFIDNGHLKLGVKKTSGAGVAWLSASGSERNLINHFDRGRLVQQSYYGKEDGSLWGKQPWRYNPVQGGDWRGKGAKVLELKAEKTSLFARSIPKHWASGKELDETSMEQQIELCDDVVHIHYKFAYRGKETHPEHDQEIPAVFLEPDLETLVVYIGDKPWTGEEPARSKPGWPNEARKMTENWAAYVDKEGFGLGAYVPVAERLTCYRFGDGNREHGSCSYFAPLTTFAIKPDFHWEYDLYLTIGSVEEMRERFAAVRAAK